MKAKIIGSSAAAVIALAAAALVKPWEGYSPTPYVDMVGVATYCYGDTSRPEKAVRGLPLLRGASACAAWPHADRLVLRWPDLLGHGCGCQWTAGLCLGPGNCSLRGALKC